MLKRSKAKRPEPAENPAPEGAMTLVQLVDHYMKGKAPQYQVQTSYIFNFFDPQTPIEEAASRVDEYRVWMIEQRYAPGTISLRLRIALTMFNFALRRNWLTREVSVELPKSKQPIKAVPDEELKAFMNALDGWPKLMAIFMLNTGLRISELRNLKPRDIDLDKKQAVIRDTKNGEDRYIPLNDAAMNVLHKIIPERYLHDTVFPAMDLNVKFRTAAKKAKVNHVSPHMLRHTFATRLAENGVNLEVIRALGGWKRIDMAARYAKANLRTQMDAASLISDDDF